MNDEFWINNGFTSKLTHFQVPMISSNGYFKPEDGDLCRQGGMQIFVKTLSSGTITICIWVEKTDTIWDVKTKLGDNFSVSPWRQHLVNILKGFKEVIHVNQFRFLTERILIMTALWLIIIFKTSLIFFCCTQDEETNE
jgi:hypothetical protein